MTMATDPVVGRTAFVLSPGERAGQSTLEVMTDDGILIYSVAPMNAIACWNSRTPFTIENQYIIDRVSVNNASERIRGKKFNLKTGNTFVQEKTYARDRKFQTLFLRN